MPSAMERWLQLAPPAPVLTPGNAWSVFVSHASVDHVWLVNLCDALRNRGHTLFLDRPTTSEPDRLEALARSQAGLLLWSSSDRDAARMRQAFEAMSGRASGGAFPFVIA